MTTLQDQGRQGLKRYGIPESGPMDSFAFRGGNLLLNNQEGALALEFTFPGPRLLALQEVVMVITGASFTPCCDKRPIPMGEVVSVPKGSELSFSSRREGRWSYLFVQGGFFSTPVLGSSSTYLQGGLGGIEGRCLQEGDVLFQQEGKKERVSLGRRLSPFTSTPYERETIRVLPGPQFHYFTPDGIDTFFKGDYRVGLRWDRMGYFLEGPAVEAVDSQNILSEGLTPGAIQIMGEGTVVVMMADAQTIGGYKKLGWVLKQDLPALVQRERGDLFRFQQISREEAQMLIKKQKEHRIALGRPRSFQLSIGGRRFAVDIEAVEE